MPRFVECAPIQGAPTGVDTGPCEAGTAPTGKAWVMVPDALPAFPGQMLAFGFGLTFIPLIVAFGGRAMLRAIKLM